MDEKPVRACLCYPHTFAELKSLARLHGWATTADITRAVGCGSGCGLCRPYLAKMLATGETTFSLLPPVDRRGFSKTLSAAIQNVYSTKRGHALNLSESYDGIASEMWDYMGGDTPGADFEFYARKIRELPGTALDLTCGSGKHLLRYLKMGLDVEGVDASETMLANCRRKAEQQGLTPILYKQSIQTLDLPRKYKTIFISAGSFQLLGDRNEAIEALRRFFAHLEPGGQLLFETFLPDEAFKLEPDNSVTVWGPTIRPRDGAAITTHLWTESADRFEQVKVEKRRYEASQNGHVIESELHTMTLRWYFKYEMIMMLAQAGFRDIFLYGDYTDSAAIAASSEIVYSARR